MKLSKNQRIAIALTVAVAAAVIFVAYRTAQVEKYRMKDVEALKAAGVTDNELSELVRQYLDERTLRPRDRSPASKNTKVIMLAAPINDVGSNNNVVRAVMCPENRNDPVEKSDCDQGWLAGARLCDLDTNAEEARWMSFPASEARASVIHKYWAQNGKGYIHVDELNNRDTARIEFLQRLKVSANLGRCVVDLFPQ